MLLRPRTLLILLAVSLSSTLFSTLRAYAILLDDGRKGAAETVFFLGFVAVALELLFGAVAFAESRRRRADLDAVVELVRSGGSVPVDRLGRLGPVGARIRMIFQEIAETSERKSARIASLTGLIRAVLELTEDPVLVVSLDGLIVEASRGAKSDARLTDMRIGQSRIDDALPDIDMRSVLREADRTHAAVDCPGGVRLFPVFSVRGEVCHFFADLSEVRSAGLSERISAGLGLAAGKDRAAAGGGRVVRNAIGTFYGRLRKRLGGGQ